MKKSTEDKVKELQLLEHTLQNLMMQRQAFSLELNEVMAAREELEKSNGVVYKILGNVMLESNKEEMKKDLNDKKNIFDLRIKNIEKQEKILKEKTEEMRKDVLKELKTD